MAGTLATHELDAIKRHEWRILPLTSFMPERIGEAVFVWAHVPLFALIIWIAEQGAASTAAQWLSGFAVVHVGLHWLYRNHPMYEFNNLRSWVLVLLPGVFGAVHLAMVC